MIELSSNCYAPAFSLNVSFSFGVRHERRTSEIDLGGSPVAVIHGLHGSRYADIYEGWRLRIPCAFALLRNGARHMHTKQAQGRGVKKFNHTSSVLSKVTGVNALPGL